MTLQCLWISICDWLRITGNGKINDGRPPIEGARTTMEHVQALKKYAGCKDSGGIGEYTCNESGKNAVLDGSDQNQPTHLALKNLAGKLNVTIRIFTSNSTSKLYLAGFEDFTQLYKQRVSNTGDKESDNYFNNLVYKYLDVYGDNIGFTEDLRNKYG